LHVKHISFKVGVSIGQVINNLTIHAAYIKAAVKIALEDLFFLLTFLC